MSVVNLKNFCIVASMAISYQFVPKPQETRSQIGNINFHGTPYVILFRHFFQVGAIIIIKIDFIFHTLSIPRYSLAI